MVRSRTVALLAGLIAAGTASYFVIKAAQAKGGGGQETVSITVTDGSGGSAVPYVGVTIDLQSSVTNAQGVATFQGVQDGPHTLSVNASGYQAYTESINVGPYSTTFTAPLAPCVQQQCGCGQTWDPTLCECDTLKPSYIVAPPNVLISQNWIVNAVNIPGITCGMFDPNNPPACGSGLGCDQSPGDTVHALVKVKVTDSAGRPICGEQVAGSISINQVPFSARWPCSGCSMDAFFNVSLASDAVPTDADGFATFLVAFQIAGISNSCCICPFIKCGPASTTLNVPVNLTTELSSNPQVKALTTVVMKALVCAWVYT